MLVFSIYVTLPYKPSCYTSLYGLYVYSNMVPNICRIEVQKATKSATKKSVFCASGKTVIAPSMAVCVSLSLSLSAHCNVVYVQSQYIATYILRDKSTFCATTSDLHLYLIDRERARPIWCPGLLASVRHLLPKD
jgi:hypothetical protein